MLSDARVRDDREIRCKPIEEPRFVLTNVVDDLDVLFVVIVGGQIRVGCICCAIEDEWDTS